MFEIVFGLLRRLSDDQPVALILEDLHWADSSTRDLLRFLVRNARDARFLIIGTYRSDELHRRHPLRPLLAELERLEGVDDIELGAFSADELADQLAGITGEAPHPELVSAVLSRSGGNPFFVEELMAAGEGGLALSRSLRDTIDDRVRHLDGEAQRVLRIASVAGARVDHWMLAEVAALAEPILTEALRQAVEHHLLVPTAPEEVPGYRFRHALVHEVVYEELLPNERTHLHAAYAVALERRALGNPRERAGVAAQLAHHWLMAHDLERALPATLARRARRRRGVRVSRGPGIPGARPRAVGQGGAGRASDRHRSHGDPRGGGRGGGAGGGPAAVDRPRALRAGRDGSDPRADARRASSITAWRGT